MIDSQMPRVQAYPTQSEYKHPSITLHEYDVTYSDNDGTILLLLPADATRNIWVTAMTLTFTSVATTSHDLWLKTLSE